VKISNLGLALLELFEDYRSTAYPDPRGIWTCGYGHTGPDVKKGTTCTLDQASVWLLTDVAHAESVAESIGGLTQNQFDAVTSLVYNIGEHAFLTSTLHAMLESGAENAPDQFLAWNHINGVVNDGLTRRRRVERALFMTA
jgi:lysozyme